MSDFKKKNLISHGILRPNRKPGYLAMLILFIISFTIIRAQVTDTVTIAVHPGWNIVSVPLVVSDNRTITLFPNAKSSAFSYHHGYVSEDSIITSQGYWIKFDTAEIIPVVGTHPPEPCISLEKGWNLVGMFSRDIPVQIIYTDPSENLVSEFYGFNASGYYQADTLKPGVGYWIKAKNACIVTATGGSEGWEFVTTYRNAFATHPTDPNIFYAGINSDFSYNIHGMILKSTTMGSIWDTLVRNVDAGLITIDTIDPQIVYVSCGIANGDRPGILKTTNGGTTWFHADNGMFINSETSPGLQAINPNDHNILYASTYGFYGGIPYKSTNGGELWLPVVSFDSIDCAHGDTFCYMMSSRIKLNPQNPNTVYDYNGERTSFFFKSYDASETWSIAYEYPLGGRHTMGMRELDWRDSNIIYVSLDSGFFKTTNGGEEWNRIDSSFPSVGGIGNMLFTDEQNTSFILWYNTIYQTTNGGITWFSLPIDNVVHIQLDNFGFLYAIRLDGIYRERISRCN